MHDTDRTLAELARMDGEVGETDFELDGEDFENEGDFEFEPEAGTEMAHESDFEDEGDYEADYEEEADFEEEVPNRTDFMPLEEFRRRMRMHIAQGWQPILPRQEVMLYPVFSANFDKFAASAAYELRHYIVYQSDGGVFARGLVRATGDLQKIHKDLRDQKFPEGQKVRLAAALYRRRHPDPTKQFMMSIQFAHVPIRADVEVVRASPAVTQQAEKNLAERVIRWAEQAGNEPKWSGDRKKRIADWARLARRLGYPRFLELWHYNRNLVALFVQFQFEHRRKEMTGGKAPPYDGSWGAIPWRVYPFKLIMAECKKRTNVNDCYAHAANQLKQSEQDILAMIDDVYKAMLKYDSARSTDPRRPTTGSPQMRYGSLAPLMLDLKKQLADVNTLMHPYTKYTQFSQSLWGSF
jgi:hypothetical protein